jgi:hypothetical protein
MLDKAISYVKFLQLQVKVCEFNHLYIYIWFFSVLFFFFPPKPMDVWTNKNIYMTPFLGFQVLATDEFWPVQGGKAPDISQVKEAIDAILSSQRDRSSSS